MEGIERHLIRSTEQMNALRSDWEKMQQGKEMTVFQGWEWNLLLFEEEKKRAFSKLLSEVCVYIVRQNGEAVLLLPVLYQKRGNRTKWFGRDRGLYILGHGSYSDYLNAVYGNNIDKETIVRLIGRIREDFPGCPFYATDIREDTVFCEALNQMKACVTKERKALQVDLAESKEAYEQSLSKHVKQNLRTARNRMKRDNYAYKLEVMGRTEDRELLEQLLTVHIDRMKEKNRNDEDIMHRLSSGIRIRYRAGREKKNNIISESMKRMDQSCLVITRLNDDIAGYLYGLYDRDVIRIMQNCIKTKYRFYSPMFRGAYDFILEQYDSREPRHIDFTRGNEQYKYDLGGSETTLFSFVI